MLLSELSFTVDGQPSSLELRLPTHGKPARPHQTISMLAEIEAPPPTELSLARQ